MSLGCILYGLCKLHYYDENIISIKDKIMKENYLINSKIYSENINKTIKQLIENKTNIQKFLMNDDIIKIIEKVGLLAVLYDLYPLQINNPGNNDIDHVYHYILKRNKILDDSIFNLNYNKNSYSWKREKEKTGYNLIYYYPPNGWIGIGLNIDKYGSDKNWLNKENGWVTAYHGLRLEKTKDEKYNILNCNEYDLNMKLELTIKSIIKNGLKDGINQPFQFERNSFFLSRNKYHNCQEGVYLSFQVEEAKKYTIPISGYIFVLMCKVCPNEIRTSRGFKGEFVSNENYIRPYRILAQKYN